MKSHTHIIAEAGVNHNGSLERARELVRIAAEAGADSVKFQSFKAESLASALAPKAEYQTRNMGEGGSQLEMLKKLELRPEEYLELAEYSKKNEIEFLSSPFDADSAAFLAREMNLRLLKIPSGEITNAPYLLELGRLGKPLILSTGMCTLDEIREALGVLAFAYTQSSDILTRASFVDAYESEEGQKALKNKVTLLHCTTEYPTPFEQVNLNAMRTLSNEFKLPIGYSDHTVGISVPIAAVALGATVIEKHFTISRKLPGPDHAASLEAHELKDMVKSIREIEKALGSNEKIPALGEIKNRIVARKSLVAAKDIQKGEAFTIENLVCKRPGSGLSPIAYWDHLGQPCPRDLKKDELL